MSAELTGRYWPAHPHPFPGELLSSWLVRLAHANGLKVQTFCEHAFGKEHQLWNRDIDRSAPDWLIQLLSQKTGTPLLQAWDTTLLRWEGVLYPKRHAAGWLPWILPLHLYHRKRLGHGMQFCPACLREDGEAFYRAVWRVALYTFCPTHEVMLWDRCPHCGEGVAFHRLELGHPGVRDTPTLAQCWACGMDFREAPCVPVETGSADVLPLWRQRLRQLEGTPLATDAARLLEDLSILHHLCALLVSVRLAPKLRPFLCQTLNVPLPPLQGGHWDFERRPVQERHHVFALAGWLMQAWPNRLYLAWRRGAVRYSALSKDFDDPPARYRDFLQHIAGAAKSSRYAQAFAGRRRVNASPLSREGNALERGAHCRTADDRL